MRSSLASTPIHPGTPLAGRLAHFFGTNPELRLNLQPVFELGVAEEAP
jgi:plasmid maintenance system antidote protein VapI